MLCNDNKQNIKSNSQNCVQIIFTNIFILLQTITHYINKDIIELKIFIIKEDKKICMKNCSLPGMHEVSYIKNVVYDKVFNDLIKKK